LKVLFINNGMPHYYNAVLNGIHRLPGIELVLVAPAETSRHIGAGVHQSAADAAFRVVRLPECTPFGLYHSFKGLARTLQDEKPAVVIVPDAYLWPFIVNPTVLLAMKALGARLILKSIPFGLASRTDAFRRLSTNPRSVKALPGAWRRLVNRPAILKGLRALELAFQTWGFNQPHAHVNYIDAAVDIFASYGVPRRRVFVIRNSPDTDRLLAIRESLERQGTFLPPSDHRIIHVGRLVAWKRVDLLLRALARVRVRFPDAELVVIGKGPQEQAWQQLAACLQLNGAVRFVGGVYDPVELGRYLMASSLYVLAGMGGLSINEAMCFGLPVICSVCDGTEKFLVRDGVNGKYFKEGDVEDLAAKITGLFQDPLTMREMGRRSISIIEQEVNLHTVIDGYAAAIDYVMSC
jgi:glycosyltransferase involved in cell wall biosynthesis